MKAENTKDKIEFIIDHVWWAFIAWIWYNSILFRCLGTHSFMESKWILAGCVVGCCAVGIFLQWRKRRNSFSLFANLAAGYGIYAVATYLPVHKKLIVTILLIAAILALAYSALVFCRKIKNKKKRKKIIIRRLKFAGIGVKNIVCVGLAVIMGTIVFNSIFGIGIIRPSVSAARQSDIDRWTIDNNLDTLSLLEEERWKTLTVEEKLGVLQTIANIEQRYMGLPNELNVGAENLREGWVGYYSDSNHAVIVSMDSLLNDSSYEVVRIVAHEAYHSLQHRMVDAYDEASEEMKTLILFRNASVYKEEFADYTDGLKDFCGYYSQQCESSARTYSKSAADDYFERINEYLKARSDP